MVSRSLQGGGIEARSWVTRRSFLCGGRWGGSGEGWEEHFGQVDLSVHGHESGASLHIKGGKVVERGGAA